MTDTQNENAFESEFEDNKDSSASEPIEVDVPSVVDVVNPEHVEDDNPEEQVGDEVKGDG